MSGFDVIGNDPWGPPRAEPLPEGGTWGDCPHDLEPTALKIALDDFAVKHELEHKTLIRMVNWVYNATIEHYKDCVSRNQCLKVFTKFMPMETAKHLYAALPKFIDGGDFERIGMESVFMLKAGYYGLD